MKRGKTIRAKTRLNAIKNFKKQFPRAKNPKILVETPIFVKNDKSLSRVKSDYSNYFIESDIEED